MLDKDKVEMEFVGVRLSCGLRQRIEDFRREQPGGETLTLSQALRMLVELGLESARVKRSFNKGGGSR